MRFFSRWFISLTAIPAFGGACAGAPCPGGGRSALPRLCLGYVFAHGYSSASPQIYIAHGYSVLRTGLRGRALTGGPQWPAARCAVAGEIH